MIGFMGMTVFCFTETRVSIHIKNELKAYFLTYAVSQTRE